MTTAKDKPAAAAIKELLSQSPDGLREIVRAVMQEMLEAEMTDALQAQKGERTAARLGYRSGYYTRTLITRVGKLELRVPQDRDGRFSTELFERYQRSEQALVATLAEMYVQGVSTRKVKAITEELCGHSFSASAVSAINKRLDESLAQFSSRRLEEPFPYLILDARYETVREGGIVASQAVLIAVGIDWDGRRQILGVEMANRESQSAWRTFLLGLRERGLSGVELVVADDHAGLRAAIRELLSEAAYQRCRVHTIRTQSSNGVSSVLTSRRRAAQGNDMTDLQAAVVNDDAVDDQLQESLPVLKRGILQPDLNPLAERPQIGHHRLSLVALVAQATLLLELKIQGMTLVGQLPAAVLQFLQADHLRLVRIQQAPVAPRQPVQTGPKLALGLRSTRRSLTCFIGKRLELGKQPIRIAEKAPDMVPHRSLQVISLDVSP